jgi:DNA-binding NarL/FixJ family response regulator
MTHLRDTTANGRHILSGLGHLEVLRRWGRDRLHDAAATNLASRFTRPVDGPLASSTSAFLDVGLPIQYQAPDILSNGHAQLVGLGAAGPSSPVAPAELRCAPPNLIVDDCKLNRENLSAIFASRGGSESAVAWDAPSLCAALAEVRPEIVLFNMSTRDSLTLLRILKDRCPEAKVIVVGIREDDESQIVACAEAGVAGYHLRAESLDRLLTLMSRVANGESLCTPKVSAILLRRLSALAAQRRPEVKELVLTAREIQILRLIESGLSNQEIADHLYIAVHTVKNHVHSLLTKLGVSTRIEAAAYARSIQTRTEGEI